MTCISPKVEPQDPSRIRNWKSQKTWLRSKRPLLSKAEEEDFELGENRQLLQGSQGAEQASVGPTDNKSGGADEKSFMDSSGHGFKVSSWNVAGMSVADIKNEP